GVFPVASDEPLEERPQKPQVTFPEDALEAERQAMKHWQELAKQFPRDASYRQELARSRLRLASLLAVKNLPGEAEPALRQGLELQQQLLREGSGSAGSESDWAEALFQLANILRNRAKPGDHTNLVEAGHLLEEAVRHQHSALSAKSPPPQARAKL